VWHILMLLNKGLLLIAKLYASNKGNNFVLHYHRRTPYPKALFMTLHLRAGKCYQLLVYTNEAVKVEGHRLRSNIRTPHHEH